MLAIDAYEAAKAGKAIPIRQMTTRRASGTRSGSKRHQLFEVVRSANGFSRGEVLEKMILKSDKAGDMPVSNALTALTKANQIVRRDGKYVSA